MNLFSKPTATPEPSADLPEGHDDPASPLHVPEPAREFYAATARPSRAEIDARMDVAAWEQAAREAKAKYVGTDERGDATFAYPFGDSFRAELAQRAQHVRDLDYERLHALAVHELRMVAAMLEKNKRDRRAEDEARQISEQTCPRCKQRDPDANGFVQVRDLMDEPGVRARHPFRSCFGCYSVKRAQMLTQWSVNRLPDGRTRGDAVSEA